MFKRSVLFFILLSLLSCNSDRVSHSGQSLRPMDTWVYRTVLDEMPRMLFAALHRDLYVAYDTQKAKLYKAWKGVVNFQGAVYDGAHGPQPTTVGDAYMIDHSGEDVWKLVSAGSDQAVQIDYKGHGFVDGSLELHYNLAAEGIEAISISEKLDYAESETGQLQLKRVFKLENCPEDVNVILKSKAVLVDKSQIISTGTVNTTDAESIRFDTKQFLVYPIELGLNKNAETEFTIPLLETVYLDPNISDGFDAEDSSLPRGAQLIGKNDCKTCHNVSKQTVGPSYMAIAKKYEHNDENRELLINKIIKGGSGVWGEQVMTPHPEIPKYDLEEMLDYIFSLADFEGVASVKEDNLELMEGKELESTLLIPGILTRVYEIPHNTSSFPADIADTKPIQAGIMENYNNLSGGDFKGLESNFAIVGMAYLNIPETGEYSFRLWSDDGSKLYIHDKLVIDNDGLHGTTMKQTTQKLGKGYHPIRIEFFQGQGGKFLSFNMKSENDESWHVVSKEMISHSSADHKYLTSMSLPMSVLSKIPGDGIPVAGVHPAFSLKQARPEDFVKKIGGIDFMSDGRMVVSTWEQDGGVFMIENHESGNPDEMAVTKIAAGLAEPLGLKIVDDRIFVMQKQEMTELIDHDGDSVIDEYKTLCDDWGVSANFHEFGFGLEAKDGYLYANLATGILPGGAGMPNQHPDRGSAIRVSIEDGSLEFVAHGLRTPNGVGIAYKGDIFVSDNQGDWLPSSKILHVQKGDWFGSRAVDFEGTASKKEKKPVVWLPQDEIGNSPSTPLSLDLGPYQNQMIHGEVTHGGVKRVFVDEIEGQLQGCVFRFIQGLEAGINRLRWAPDGALYVGGIGNPGNWQHTGKSWYGLQRLEYNGASVFEMLAVRAMSDGIEIEFTEPLKSGDGWDRMAYEIRQWRYVPTAEYGGPKIDEEILDILSVNISDDRTKVFLELDGMKDDHLIYVRLNDYFVSENENSLWTTEAWYTMNHIPSGKRGFRSPSIQEPQINSLSEAERQDGWELLFDGKSFDKFHTYNRDTVAGCWSIEDGLIHLDTLGYPEKGDLDLVTNDEYEKFELKLEWKISNCGNSGIMFNVQEGDQYCCPYLTGPEMQVLDNTCHPDARIIKHRAGDLYDMISCNVETVKPAGEWNKVRLVSNNGDVQFWLNGYKAVEFTMHNEEWDEMVANSKFRDWENFGKYRSGKIVLQDHDDRVWYRNIKIKRL